MRSKSGWLLALVLSLVLIAKAMGQVGAVFGGNVDGTPNPLPPAPSSVTKIGGGSGGANISGLLSGTFYGISSAGVTLLSRKDSTDGTGWGNTGAQPAAQPYGFAVFGSTLLEANTENCGGGGSACNVYSSSDGNSWTANPLPGSGAMTAASAGYRGQGNLQCSGLTCYAVTRSGPTGGCSLNSACLAIFQAINGAWGSATVISTLDNLGTFVGVLLWDGTNLGIVGSSSASILNGCGGSCSEVYTNGNVNVLTPAVDWTGMALFNGAFYLVSDPSIVGQYKKSTDGGITWGNVTPVFTPAIGSATLPTILQAFNTQFATPTLYMIWTGNASFSVYTSIDGVHFTRIYNELNQYIGGNLVFNSADKHLYFGASLIGTGSFNYYKIS